MPGAKLLSSVVALLLITQSLLAQNPQRGASAPAIADARATELGGFLLSIPGVADDFVLFADGAIEERANGTARISAYLNRLSAIDREFYLVLELGGRLKPNDVGYPPAGAPVVTLQPSAYLPTGVVDPGTFTFYTTGTGSLTGLRTYAGAKLNLALGQPAQLGIGASNKNVLDGLAANLTVTIVQQPASGNLVPTGPAELRAELRAQTTACFSHVDSSLAASGNTNRLAICIAGLGDYLYVPAGTWSEDALGNASVQVELREPGDFADAWWLQLQLGGRVLPGAPAFPPAGSPVLTLLPGEYAAQGGAIDSSQWRYYTTANGILTGLRNNVGGSLQLGTAGPLQVGLGAAGGNRFFGISGPLNATLLQSPSSHAISPTGPVQLAANLSSDCLLPSMVVTSTTTPVTPSVTMQTVQLSGTDIGLCEQVAIGPRILGTDEQMWVNGFVRPASIGSAEIAIPQGLVPGQYPMLLIHRSGTSNQLVLDVQAPAAPALATEPTRAVGDTQHLIAHQGNLVGFTFCFFVLSFSNLPSDSPGFVTLGLGAMFSDITLLDIVITDQTSGAARASLPNAPAGLQGLRLYSQAAFMDYTIYHLFETNLLFTDY